MQSRKSGFDYDEEKRKRIFYTYMEMIEDHSKSDIAKHLGMNPAVLHDCIKRKWWAELRDETKKLSS